MSEADKNAVWTTAVRAVKPPRVAVRGYYIAELEGGAVCRLSGGLFDFTSSWPRQPSGA